MCDEILWSHKSSSVVDPSGVTRLWHVGPCESPVYAVCLMVCVVQFLACSVSPQIGGKHINRHCIWKRSPAYLHPYLLIWVTFNLLSAWVPHSW